MAQLVLKLKDREITRLVLDRTITTVGRDPGCDLTIDNPAVSRRHLMILFDGGAFRACDQGSSNGVIVNGHLAADHVLRSGDEIQIGKFTLGFLEGARNRFAVEELAPASPSRVLSPDRTTMLALDEISRFVSESRALTEARRRAASAPALRPVPSEPSEEASPRRANQAATSPALVFGALFAGILAVTAVLLQLS